MTGPADDGSRALIDHALAGRPAAVRQLVRRLMPVIQARVDRRLMKIPSGRLGAHDREDAAQEIWLALVKDDAAQLRKWDPARGATLEGYVGMVAEREIFNLTRKELSTEKRSVERATRPVEALDEIAANGETPEDIASAHETSRALAAYVAENLPPKGRAICRYLYGDRLAPDAVAETLNITRQVVYNWQHRIRRLVEDFLAKTPAD